MVTTLAHISGSRNEVSKDHARSPGFTIRVISTVLSLSSVAAFVSALAMAPPRSGPFCQETVCITYPYTDAAAHVPNDYIWMYPALLMCLSFFAWVVAVLQHRLAQGSFAALVATGFAGMSITLLLFAYAVQLMVMQPALVLGETDSLSAWSQYNPHGLFIALENAGYWLAALALVVLAIAAAGVGTPARWIQRLCLVSGIAVVTLLPIMAAIYGSDLAYRFEVFAIAVLWPTFAILGLLGARLSPLHHDHH